MPPVCSRTSASHIKMTVMGVVKRGVDHDHKFTPAEREHCWHRERMLYTRNKNEE